MERLNDIMGRTAQRRPHYSEQRSSQPQGQQVQQSQQPSQAQQDQQQPNMHTASRPPLREQNARQGQQRPYVPQNQPAPTPRIQRQPTSYEGRSYGQQPAVRPIPTRPQQTAGPSQRPVVNKSTTYQPQRPERQIVQEQPLVHPLQTRPMYVQHHHADEYALSPVVSADVVEDWEDEEGEETGMQYGDWEEGESEVVIYQRSTPEPQTRPRGMASTQPSHDYEQVYPQHPLVTRELTRPSSNQQGYGTRTLRDVQPSQPPTPPVRVQEVQHPYRSTQPLNSLVNTATGRERPIPQGQAQQHMQQRPLRQIVPPQKTLMREQAVMPYTTSTSLPEVTPLAPAKSACPRCKGAGYLRANVPFGHPNFGKPLACECKEAERKEKRRQQLRDMSNMDAFRNCNFRSFNPHLPGTQEAFQSALEFAQSPDGWLFLIGPNGCGKTHLAAAIANQSLDEGAVVLFAVVPDLLDHLRAAFAPNATEVYDQLFAKMREAELLILDDLGAQQSSSWANEKLFQLLNYRYNMGMPTVITANPKGLQGVDERIRSRLSDISLVATVVLDRAKDYRPHHPRRD
ncbi:MAG: hypothetical protein PVS3B3_34890 [Ktedonobacteraceae bacterium]